MFLDDTKATLMKRVLWSMLSLFIVVSLSMPNQAFAQQEETESQNREILQILSDSLDWVQLRMGLEPGEDALSSVLLTDDAGSSIVDWFAFTLGRLGYEGDRESYLAALADNVNERYATEIKLDSRYATEWHRIALTVLALGGDPTSFGEDPSGDPINLVADGTYYRGNDAPLGGQGINGYIYALLLLDSLEYPVPDDAVDTRESIVTAILSGQLEDGGFSFANGAEASIDLTAMALQALAPYYDDETTYTYTSGQTETETTKTVKEAVDKALAYLSGQQTERGDFGLDGTVTVETAAQVIVALCSLGLDISNDDRFLKEGNSAIDGLLLYHNDDGGFAHVLPTGAADTLGSEGASDLFSTQQALNALVAFARQTEGMNSFFNLKPDTEPSLYTQMKTSDDVLDTVDTAAGDTIEVQYVLVVVGVIILALAGSVIIVRKRLRRNESEKQ